MTTATDDFNRANGVIGANYTVSSGTTSPDITSNQLTVGGTSEHACYRSAESFGDDQYSQIEVRTHGDFSGVIARHLTSGAFTAYLLGCDSSNVFTLNTITGGSFASFTAATVATIGTGTTLKLEVIGSLIRAYRSGMLAHSAHNTTFTTGKPGIRMWNAATVFDNWEGGDTAALPTTGLFPIEVRHPGSFPNGTSQVYNNVHFGAAAGDREILVFVHGFPSGAAFTLTCDVAGVTATEEVTTLAGNNHRTSLFRAAVPTGTTGTITLTSSQNAFAMNINVYVAYGLGALLDTATGTTTGTGAISLDVDVEAGGKVVGCTAAVSVASSNLGTWVGLTRDIDTQGVGSGWWNCSASLEPVSTTTLTVSVASSSTTAGQAAVVASFEATAGGSATLDAESAAYVWAATDATLTRSNYILTAESAAYVWNASDASLEYAFIGGGGGAGSGGLGQARSRAGGFWRGGKFIPYEEVAPPPPPPPEPEPEPLPEPVKAKATDTKRRSSVGEGMAETARQLPKVRTSRTKAPGQPVRSGEVKAPTPPVTLEERVAKAIEIGIDKALKVNKGPEPTAEEIQQAEEEREMKLLKQLGFLS